MLFAVLCGVAALSPTAGRAQSAVDYAAPVSWLCLPGRSDACSAPLTSTVISADTGEPSRRNYSPDSSAPIDCFYVYPTVSRDPTPNADMTPGPEERRVATTQLARFGARCRTFAPLYRQTTITALLGGVQGADRELAYGDVRAAWRYYLAHQNSGRGIVLVGHSQGSRLLARLIAEEIDGKPVQQRLVSAIIPGTDVQVPVGKDVGASFKTVPLCRHADQIGCVIAYSSYLATDPPGSDARFGKAAGPGLAYACVNPGALVDDGTLDAELPTTGEVAKVLATTFVENPGLISATCTTAGDRTFLAVSIKPTGAAAPALTRALTALDARAPGWGLHGVDVNLALGDFIDIVGRQGRAWAAKTR